MEGTAIPLLADLAEEPAWILEAMFADGARKPAPPWAAVSAFHHLRDRSPENHPAYGTALLQWQRIKARYGDDAARFGAQAFLALRRSDPASGYVARILELWCRTAALPIAHPERVESIDSLPPAEAALAAEELALGAHQDGRAHEALLRRLAEMKDPHFHESRALASLELLCRGELDPNDVVALLAPPLFMKQGRTPPVTYRLLARKAELGWIPAGQHADALAHQLVLAAARARRGTVSGQLASELLEGVPSLSAAHVLAFSADDETVPHLPSQPCLLPPRCATWWRRSRVRTLSVSRCGFRCWPAWWSRAMGWPVSPRGFRDRWWLRARQRRRSASSSSAFARVCPFRGSGSRPGWLTSLGSME